MEGVLAGADSVSLLGLFFQVRFLKDLENDRLMEKMQGIRRMYTDRQMSDRYVGFACNKAPTG